MRIGALVLLAFACGQQPTKSSDILSPNTFEACEKAVDCGALDDVSACAACLEHVNPVLLQFADNIPSLETVDCSTLTQAIASTNLTTCVTERWYGHD